MVRVKIGVFDSGIGGLNVLKELNDNLCGADFIYYGDNENVPYGDKSDRKLLSLAFKCCTEFTFFNADCIVLGCNTLSLTVRRKLEEILGVPVFGVFPPVESAHVCGEKTVLVATERTCEKFFQAETFNILPCPNLASEIERNKYRLSELSFKDEIPYLNTGFDTVILGCTHYEYVKKEILDHFNAKKAVSGIKNTVDFIKKQLEIKNHYINTNDNSIVFIGKSAEENLRFWDKVVNI